MPSGIYKRTEETRIKIGNANRGKIISEETKRKISKSLKGRTCSEETRKKISNLLKGRISPMKGKHQSINTRKRISESLKGRICSEETKLKIKKNHADFSGKNHPRYGKHCSEETKRKIGIANKGNNHNLGKYHSEETKRKIGDANKGKHFSIKTEFKKGHKPSKKIIKKMKERRKYQVFPVKDTSIEVKIQNFLKELGIEFFTHKYMKIEHGYQCDILIPSKSLVIECDGDYWHGNRKLYKKKQLTKRIIKQRELDHVRTKELLEKGYKVLRLWENEINKMTIGSFFKEMTIPKVKAKFYKRD